MDRVRTMNKTLIKIIIIFSIVSALVSCNDPIFFIVHEEIPILKPLIDGSPTNFVKYDGKLYVASGKQIFSYDGSSWSKWKKLDGRIGGLAATDSSLYALYLSGDTGNGRVINLTSGAALALSNVQSIHADRNVLFVSVRISANQSSVDSYEIHCRKEGDSGFKKIPLEKTDSWLAGVASNSSYYYLCAKSGIYRVAHTIGAADIVLTPYGNDDFTGIINLGNDYIAAISRKGKLYEIDNANNIRTVINSEFNNNRSSTGALAVWYSNNTDTSPALLLAGRKENYYTSSSGYTNGYVEITLNTAGGISGDTFNEPGLGSPSSIDNNARYVSSLGKESVNHIIQTPSDIDPNMRLFASTQQHGVWSYRDRGEGMVWNAEQP